MQSQIIQGKIETADKNAVVYANVLIKNLTDTNNISEYVIAKKGTYKLELKKAYRGILIEVKSMGYKTERYRINDLQNKTYTVNFTLKINTEKIEEVEITGKRTAFYVKKDTITFNVNSYLDGTEHKAEDVIAKLPGIDVNKKTGEIKYKNKSIETVLLDDDNLFGNNYTLGTKNINVNMLEQIQAIENYSENPLLKGLESENKVVLNLKLKKQKMDFSGNACIGGGIFNDLKISKISDITALGITKNYKSFTTFSYNNIGINNTPFDYFGFSLNPEQLKEKDYYVKKIIPEISFSDIIDDRTYINNQFFGNHNFIYKIGKRIKIKCNLYYLNDKIHNSEYTENGYYTLQDTIIINENKIQKKLPVQYRGDANIKINTSKKSLLEYDFRIRQEEINSNSSVLSNNQSYDTGLKTNDFFAKHKLLFTQKISKVKVLQLSVLRITNNITQDLNINPSLFDAYNRKFQNCTIKKNYTVADASFFGKKRNRYRFSSGGIFTKDVIVTKLSEQDQNSDLSENKYYNGLNYSSSEFYQSASYMFDFKRWQIAPTFQLRFLNQSETNIFSDSIINKTNFIGKPGLNIKYFINEYSSFIWFANYDKYSDSENYLVQNPVLINYRTIISNTSNTELNKVLTFGFNYHYNNLYNVSRINIGIKYQQNTGKYFSDISVNENLTHLNYFFSRQKSNNWIFNVRISKYISLIESKIDLSSSYSYFQYNNIINNSELRKNRNNNINTILTIGTAFNLFINFTYELNNNRTQSKNENFTPFIVNSLNNTFKIRLTFSKRFFALISMNYLLPNIKKDSNSYKFLDTEINYLFKNKRSQITLSGNNLLNMANYENIQVSDYNINIYKINIIQRYVLISYSFNF